MRPFLQKVTANGRAVVLAVALAALAGLYALLHLPVGLFPGMDVPVVNIVSLLPGAAPQEVERLVTRPIEDRMRGLQGVARVSSTSLQEISLVTVGFRWGTRLLDARQLIQAALSSLRQVLPAGVIPRLENTGTRLQEVVSYVAYGDADPVTLRTAVRQDVRTRLMGLEGVWRVEILGGDERAFVVEPDPAALARLGLTVTDIVRALRRNNIAGALGFIERGARDYLIRGDARYKTLEDVRAVAIPVAGSGPILLGSLARVREGYAPRHYTVHGDGGPAVAFLVYKQPDASTVQVARTVDAEVEKLRSILPPGVRVRKFYDQSEIILEARDALLEDLVIGATLAALVLLLFLRTFRAMLTVAAAIPISLVVTLVAMRALGLSLNVITISALTLAVGMVVDDAIVVAENIFRHLERGEPPAEASVEGAARIAGPDISGTLTTMAAFLPLVAAGGIAGLFIEPFGLVVSAALLVSLLVSLTFVPAVVSRWRGGVRRGSGIGSGPARFPLGIDRPLLAGVRFASTHRRLTLAVAVLSLGLFALALGLGPARVLPRIDEGTLLIEYILPPGTSLEETHRIGERLDRIALADPDVLCVYRRTGSPSGGIFFEGANAGELTIKLRPRARRRRSAFQIMDRLEAAYMRIHGVVYLFRQPTQEKMEESLSGLPAVFGVTIYGPDTERLVELAARAEKIMAADPALAEIVNNTRVRASTVAVRLDAAKLARHGIEPAEVLDAVRSTRLGLEATRIVRAREEVHVLVKMPAPAEGSIDALRKLPIPVPNGGAVPLERLADVRITHVPATITRLNGRREVTLLAEVEGSIPAAVGRLRAALAEIPWPPAYSFDFTGQYRVLLRTVRDLALIALGAVVLIYLIMTVQFRSLVQPLVILVAIPFAAVGSVVALAASGQPIDISAGMGFLTLAGISVNNGIVLLDYANRRRAAGREPFQAIQEAVSVRLRPISMTALTTIAGLLPVAASRAAGSKIFQPFAVVVIGGLLSATAATIFLVPSILAGHRRGAQGSRQPGSEMP